MVSLLSRASTPLNPYSDDSPSSLKPHDPPTPTESTLNCEIEDSVSQYRPQTRWRRILKTVFPGQSIDKGSDNALPLLSSNTPRPKRIRQPFRKFKLSYCLLVPLLGFFVMLGIIKFISIACAIVLTYFPDEFDRAASHWLNQDATAGQSHWPTDISRDIVPVGCHSHNDYWRRVPLFSALQAGCISVEADVWLFDNELYVGHSTSALTPERTLRSMYVDPLVNILDRQNPITRFHPTAERPFNGIFDTDPLQTLVLLIDFKTDGPTTWPQVVEQLSPLRDRGYLTYFNGEEVVRGPITVVGTGNTPFDLVVSNSTHRDIFFDAPLDILAEDDAQNRQDHQSKTRAARQPTETLGQGLSGFGSDAFNSTNSYYASASLKKSIGSPWPFRFTSHQIDRLRAQIRGAHRRGLKVRYWALPAWPRSLRNHVWAILVREGVDILNVDDLQSATRKEWTSSAIGWI